MSRGVLSYAVIFRDRIIDAGHALLDATRYPIVELKGQPLRLIDPDLCPCCEVPGMFRLSEGTVFAYVSSHRTRGGDRLAAAVELHPFKIDGELYVFARMAYEPDTLKPGGGAGLARLEVSALGLAAVATASVERWPEDLVGRASRAASVVGWFVQAFKGGAGGLVAHGTLTALALLREEDVAGGSPLAAVLDDLAGLVGRLGR